MPVPIFVQYTALDTAPESDTQGMFGSLSDLAWSDLALRAQTTRTLLNEVSHFGSLTEARRILTAQNPTRSGRETKHPDLPGILAQLGSTVLKEETKHALTLAPESDTYTFTCDPVTPTT